MLGEEYLRERLAELDLRVSPFAFLQTNTETAERLYAIAREYAGLGSGERLFDLYCGIGTIGLSMAADAGEVWGIESVADAIVDAEANAKLNGISNARFRAGDARLGIRPLIEEVGKPDVVVVDPPRAGLSAKIVRRVLECEAKRIVYVSCNATTMAPNARQIVDAGYRLTRVRPVDMFPQTPHIECVALFERAGCVSARGFGVAAGLDSEVATPLAARCAELGYTSMWANDHPAASGLETLADFAAGSAEVELGVAVIALDRHTPAEIDAKIDECGLDRDRLLVGVGAGFSRKPLTRMREAHDELREAIPGVRLILAAMGPKMCALAGATLRRRLLQLDDARLRRRRSRAGRGRARATPAASVPRVYGYVRTSVGADAETRLAKEEGFYRDLHDGYRNHFERLGEPPGTVGVAAENPDDADARPERLRGAGHRRRPGLGQRQPRGDGPSGDRRRP